MRSVALGFLFLNAAVSGVVAAAMPRGTVHEVAARKAGRDFMYLGIPIHPTVVGGNPIPAVGEGHDHDDPDEPTRTDVPDVPDAEDGYQHEDPDQPKETAASEVPDARDDEQGDAMDDPDECEEVNETDEPIEEQPGQEDPEGPTDVQDPPQATPAPETPEDEIPEDEIPEDETPAPPAVPASNPLIESISWDGTGCPPRESEADDTTPSVQVNLEPDGSFGAFFFAGFDAYIGWGSEDDSQIEKECMISMDIVEIPEGWSFQIADLRAEGSIHLALGAVAVFNGTIFWSGEEDHVLSRGKYWPNLDREDPISQQYITDPVVLTAAEQVEFGSTCTEKGDGPSSGTLNIGFRIAMQSDAEEPPDGLVTVGAIGITSRLAECK